jgi:hypothetical protein
LVRRELETCKVAEVYGYQVNINDLNGLAVASIKRDAISIASSASAFWGW